MSKRGKMKTTVLLCVGALALSACANDANGGPTTTTTTTPVDNSAPTKPGAGRGSDDPRLRSFDTCDGLLEAVKADALERVGPYGLEGAIGDPRIFDFDDALVGEDRSAATVISGDGDLSAPEAAADASAPNQDVSAATPSDTGTNVQEAGVDEPDIIKTDGKRVITLSGSILTVADITDRAPKKTAEITLGASPYSMMLANDRLFLFADANTFAPYDVVLESDDVATDPSTSKDFRVGPKDTVLESDDVANLDPIVDAAPNTTLPEPWADGTVPYTAPVEPWPDTTLVEPWPDTTLVEPWPNTTPGEPWVAQTSILEVVLDPVPAIAHEMTVEGSYSDARLVGETLRVALSSPAQQLPWVYPQNANGEDRAAESNREVVKESTIEDWLPHRSLDGDEPTLLVDCDQIYRPATFSGFEVVSLLEIDVTDGLVGDESSVAGVGVLGRGGTVYSSTDRFYVASTNWNESIPVEPVQDELDLITPEGPDVMTDIHAFAISDSAPATYQASGRVNGELLNQFSMDESDGNLRIITTEERFRPNRNGDITSESFLRVLSEQDGELVQIGEVGGLGRGERLYSARLFDDVGFAVTFRQVDPFYVIDLSDPTNPQVTGELKIPGFSTYLHPVGDGRVLGVGAAATEEGVRTGLKVSLFDVNDPTNPTEVATWVARDTSSVAEFDHRGFHYSNGVAVVPATSSSREILDGPTGTEPENYSVVLKVDENITEMGRITIDYDSYEETSDCRPLDVEPSTDNELGWVVAEGGRVQVCDDDDTGGWGPTSCWVVDDPDLVIGYLGDELAAQVDIEAGQRVEVCEPTYEIYDEIQRVISVDNTYYSLTNRRLQANDQTSLDTLGSIDID